MKPMHMMTTRRRMLRGALGGAAVAVGVPFLDCFLNENGTALAGGAPLPIRFGTWYQGLGFTPGRWEPKTVGANYEMGPELQALTPLKSKINIYSGMKAFLDGMSSIPHSSGWQVAAYGVSQARGTESYPSIDMLISDTIGTQTRFRSLDAACDGSASAGMSRRGPGAINPPEISPAALYTRVFGPDFRDPNSADFTPDPRVMVSRSVLSMVAEQRGDLMKQVGAADRIRLDQYFTSLRELEQQMDLQLQKPAPLEACTIPAKVDQSATGTVIDDALVNAKLFSGLMAHALACGQTRVFNMTFGGVGVGSNLRQAGSPDTFHTHTHEEAVDQKLGYQPSVAWFNLKCADGFNALLTALDGIREGDGTLLDNSLVYYFTDHGYARIHSLENIPQMTAGKAGGRMKTGVHIAAKADSTTRVGLTIQQAMGVPVGSWGVGSNQTSKPFREVLA